MTEYYDIVLGLIPLVLGGVTGGALLTGISLTTAVPAGALVAIALVGHALFVNGPTTAPRPAAEPSETGVRAD